MKRRIIIVLAMLFSSSFCQAQKKQEKGTVKAEIAIPGYCCKGLNATIERTLAYEKGVVEWTLNQEKKSVTVFYKESKTSPAKIEKALAENGVRTAHEKPNPRAIPKLPACCQPAARGESSCKQSNN